MIKKTTHRHHSLPDNTHGLRLSYNVRIMGSDVRIIFILTINIHFVAKVYIIKLKLILIVLTCKKYVASIKMGLYNVFSRKDRELHRFKHAQIRAKIENTQGAIIALNNLDRAYSNLPITIPILNPANIMGSYTQCDQSIIAYQDVCNIVLRPKMETQHPMGNSTTENDNKVFVFPVIGAIGLIITGATFAYAIWKDHHDRSEATTLRIIANLEDRKQKIVNYALQMQAKVDAANDANLANNYGRYAGSPSATMISNIILVPEYCPENNITYTSTLSKEDIQLPKQPSPQSQPQQQQAQQSTPSETKFYLRSIKWGEWEATSLKDYNNVNIKGKWGYVLEADHVSFVDTDGLIHTPHDVLLRKNGSTIVHENNKIFAVNGSPIENDTKNMHTYGVRFTAAGEIQFKDYECAYVADSWKTMWLDEKLMLRLSDPKDTKSKLAHASGSWRNIYSKIPNLKSQLGDPIDRSTVYVPNIILMLLLHIEKEEQKVTVKDNGVLHCDGHFNKLEQEILTARINMYGILPMFREWYVYTTQLTALEMG